MSEPDPPSFEASLAELEDRVRRLEAGEADLEESLVLYEEGVALAQRCQAQLDAAEQRVAQLSRGTSGIEEQPIDDVD